MSNYVVKAGDSIGDVIFNTTGNLNNWDAVLQANRFTEWTPTLAAGQVIIIPDNVNTDINSLRDAQAYPKSNSLRPDILVMVQSVWDTMYNNWILKTGFWDDSGVWIDAAVWID
jgi:hypothetical protein